MQILLKLINDSTPHIIKGCNCIVENSRARTISLMGLDYEVIVSIKDIEYLGKWGKYETQR